MRAHVSAAPLLAAALFVTGCASLPTASSPPADAAPTAATAVGAAADDNLNAVLWVQRSAEYQANTISLFRAAIGQLDEALATPGWDALVPAEREQSAPLAGLPPAVIMDIDETVLDNSPYQARLVAGGGEYNEVTWSSWVEERKARPVPGVLEFARAAQARGVTILYLSNRAQHLQEATLANLRAVGMPVKDEGVFLGLGTHVEGCEQHGSEKLCRRRLAGQQYRVLMQFGDQLGDFVEVIANTPQARATLLDTHGPWFGERWWMLANPTYGSWEPALFNNAWGDSRELRRSQKREALELSK
ncbi:5'-nucleotidase, lipoprotein e(P4) family [Luteimonas sp. SDU82]